MSIRTILSHAAALGLVGAVVFAVLFFTGGSLPAAAASMPDTASAPRQSRRLLPGTVGARHGQVVARDVEVNGQRMDLDFDTLPGKTLDEAIALYQDRLSRPGEPAMERRLPDGSVYVVTKGAHGALQGVILRKVGSAEAPQVVAMPVVARGRIQPGAEADQLDVPLPPDHSQLVSYAAKDGARHGVNVDFLTDRTPDDLATWYRAALTRAGWAPARRSPTSSAGGGTRMLRYRRGNAEANISFKPLKKSGTMVLVLETRESSE